MFKKALKLMLVIICIFSFFVSAPMASAGTSEDWRDYAASGFLAGDGTQGNPYLISTPEELAYLSKQVSLGNTYAGEYLKVVGDIDIGAHQWWPIGAESLLDFHGNFDGDNWTISNIKIGALGAPSSREYGGLFGRIANNASLKNIKLTELEIYFEGNYVGGLVGYINGSGEKVSNCHSAGEISMYGGNSAYVGGLVGESYGTIENSSSQVVITGSASDHVGGLVGTVSYTGVVVNSSGHGNVSGIRYTGGLAGMVNPGGLVKNSFATGGVSGIETLGGLVGYNSGEVLNCYATGLVERTSTSSTYDGGGLVGYLDWGSTIKNSYATGSVHGNRVAYIDATGGLVGSSSGSIENSFSANEVTYGSGFAGYINPEGGTITNCFWDTTLTPTGHASATGKTTAQMKDDGFCGELNLYVAGEDTYWAEWQRLPDQRPTLITAQDYLIKRNGDNYGRGLTDLIALMATLTPGATENIELVVPQGQTPGIIAYDQGLIVPGGTTLNLKLNGYTLDVENPAGVGITLNLLCELLLDGDGIINATGNGEGGHGALALSALEVTLTNARAKGANSHGVYATADSNITLNGSAVACGNSGHGVYAEGDGIQIVIMGNVIAHGNNGKGVFCTEEFEGDSIDITIEKNALALGGDGTAAGVSGANIEILIKKDAKARATDSPGYGLYIIAGEITVEGNVSTEGYGGRGVYSRQGIATIDGNVTTKGDWVKALEVTGSGALVTVKQNVTTEGLASQGVYALEEVKVVVEGDITTSGESSTGVEAGNAADVEVGGNILVTANGSYGTYIYDRARLLVEGNITSQGFTCHAVMAEDIRAGLEGASRYTVMVNGNVTAEGSLAIGVVAENAAIVIVHGDISSANSYGAYASANLATIDAKGNVTGYSEGARAIGAIIKVAGNLEATEAVNGIGAVAQFYAGYYGNITVEGAIIATKYIKVDGADKNLGDGVLEGSYYEYRSNALNENVVKVKAGVCNIDGTPYDTFQEALDTIPVGGENPTTIILLKDINITGQVLVDNKKVMVDTNSFTLSVNNPTGIALEVRNGGKFLLAENSNGGEVNVVGNGVDPNWGTGVMVMFSDSEAVVTNASGTGYMAFGAFAYNGGKVTVRGNASASGASVMAGVESSGNDSLAIIEGNVIVSGHHYSPAFSQYFNFFGVRVPSGGNIIVEGNIVVSSTADTGNMDIGITGNPVEAAGVENSVVVEGTVTANTLVTLLEQAKTLADATLQNGYYEFSYTSWGTFKIKIKDPGYVPPIDPPVGGGGGGGGGGAEFIVKTQTADGITVTSTKISASTSGGKASSGASAAIIQALLDKAKAAQKNGGSLRDNILVEVDAPENITELDFTITRAALEQIKNDTKGGFGVASPLVSVSFDNKAIDTITKAGTGNNIVVSAGIVGEDQLSQKDREKVKGRPVYSFSVKTGGTYVSHFGGGFATVSIPYTLRAGENPNAVIVYYLDEKGSLKTIRGRYDKGTGQVVFKTPHFSQFIIGHNAVAFEDVAASAWYKPAVDFIAARGITTGIDSATFAPSATLNRGQFIVMLMRAYGLEPEADPVDNFSDAGNDYYTGYLASAKAYGITKGAGNNLYLPNAKITREEMFTLLYRSLEVIGELSWENAGKTLGDFRDVNQVSPYAKDAFESLVAGGVISGSNGALNPKGNATRGEMAQILFNLLSK